MGGEHLKYLISLQDDRCDHFGKAHDRSREYRGGNFEVKGGTKRDAQEELHYCPSGRTGGNDFRVQYKHDELQMEEDYDDYDRGMLSGNEDTLPATQPRPPGWYGERPDREDDLPKRDWGDPFIDLDGEQNDGGGTM